MKTFIKLIFSIIFLSGLFSFLLSKQPQIEQSKGLHYGSNQTVDFFDQAYKNINVDQPIDKIAGITVNHHLLAPHLIAKEMILVATDKPITVVLVSPNHFYRGNGGVITSQYDWQTPYGVLKTNQKLVKKLFDSGLVNIDETPFDQEHGINGIVGFIKKSLPNATFVSLIVKDNMPDNKADELATTLVKVLPKDTIIVGSLDFSHYLPSNGAEFHDIQTLSAINNFDYDRIRKLDIDSHPGLRLILKYFDLTGNKKFVITSHENSSTVTGNYNFIETTSYINGYFTQGTNNPDQHRTALYVQGLDSTDLWKADASDRLYKFNDQILTEKPKELDFLDLTSKSIAVGLVYNPNLTDIYLFLLDITGHVVTLQGQPNPGTMHLQIK